MKHLQNLYSLANDQGLREHGLNWYHNAHEFAADLALTYSTSLDKVAQIIAILSPAVSWNINKRDAENLLRSGESATVSTYGRNKVKALAVLWDLDTINPKALKTFAFYNNILHPSASEFVTIDRHAYKAYKGITQGGNIAINKTTYEKTAKAYKRLAKRLELKPCELQAIIWLSYRQNVLNLTNAW